MAPRKVLIIDDEVLIRKTTSILLKKMDFDVISAAGGEEGISMASNDFPDIILLDITMPIMDGWSVLERLKADEKLCSIPVIVFTAGDFTVSDKLAIEKGASAVCRKPFQPYELLNVINALNPEATHE
jgi:CheY-like chemotaxis protein